jgi:hypothetical protein
VLHTPIRIFESILPNDKNPLIQFSKDLKVIYSGGLKRSELLNLNPLDSDAKRNSMVLRQSKRKKIA